MEMRKILSWLLALVLALLPLGAVGETETIDAARAALLLQTAAYAKSLKGCPPVRLNTNGLADLIHGRSTAAEFAGKFDVISISLNAGTEAEYMAVTRPKWDNAFAAMQEFAKSVKAYVPKVMFTVVDVISKEEIAAAQAVADAAGIPLRVREYIAE